MLLQWNTNIYILLFYTRSISYKFGNRNYAENFFLARQFHGNFGSFMSPNFCHYQRHVMLSHFSLSFVTLTFILESYIYISGYWSNGSDIKEGNASIKIICFQAVGYFKLFGFTAQCKYPFGWDCYGRDNGIWCRILWGFLFPFTRFEVITRQCYACIINNPVT